MAFLPTICGSHSFNLGIPSAVKNSRICLTIKSSLYLSSNNCN